MCRHSVTHNIQEQSKVQRADEEDDEKSDADVSFIGSFFSALGFGVFLAAGFFSANVESSKELWYSLEAKYMAEDASSKKLLVSNFTNYKVTYSKPVIEQYNELLGILRRFTQHKINIDEAIQVSCIIDKLSPSWKDFKHTLKHLNKELTLVELGNHLCIKESLGVQDSDKPKGNNVAGSSVVNMVEHNNSFRLGHVHFKRMQNMSKDGLILAFGMDNENFPEEVSEEVVQQPKHELRKNKRNMTPKNFGPKFQLYLIEGTRDEKEAINDEMDPIMSNNTWVLADLPPGCKPLGCKWIFKRKIKIDGTIKKFKARLVIQGFRPKSGIDYFDTFAPVTRINTIRLLIAIASTHNLIIHQMHMKITFLTGELEEEVYMNEPNGFIMPGNGNKVCKLIKSL
uniref:Zinc finger, CCHC-type n=1 Tax=Tanacetum cinerariifolium TaxID=118510 RepID=A0A6L2NCK7_TANCI|nr:zinc finger, CCHC-type [Tanacetum cinerariifolium]